tara:strand:- start:563 stop:1201 length:639 start_codon:yes stop_codon:yes gene_type:complete
MKIPINNIIQFVSHQCNKYNIDETHSLNHALCVLSYSHKILTNEIPIYPQLSTQSHIIYTSALLHDTCDSKYSDEYQSLHEIKEFLHTNQYTNLDSNIIVDIITQMSYHKIKKHGFPNLDNYTNAFHIVREADLLAGYDFNRALLYGINKLDLNYISSFHRSKQLFDERMDKHISDNLFTTQYANNVAQMICDNEKLNIFEIEEIINKCSNL